MKLSFLWLLIFPFSVFSQADGYWDKARATTRQITVSARDRIIVPIEELPTGTTEIVFRVTLLDENQKMSSSLVSLLKAIPDPTGISAGSAGAVFLLSKISGDDQCRYALFSSSEAALAYQKEGTTTQACFYQSEPVSQDARRLSAESSACLKNKVIWFGFESKNWILKERIVLEVVPWVDYKLSRGWTADKRKSLIDICKTTELSQKLPDADDYCICVSNKIQKQYKHNEFQKLLAAEKTKAFRDSGLACYKESGASSVLYDKQRAQASQLIEKNKFGEAIKVLLPVVNDAPRSTDYGFIGWCYLNTKQYDKALKYLEAGQKADATDLLTQLRLSHAYLLKGHYSEAKALYKKFRTQNVTDSTSWSQQAQSDIQNFQKLGITHPDFERILKQLE